LLHRVYLGVDGRGRTQAVPTAIADYSEAIRLNPKYEDAFYNRANSWAHKREFDRAIADYDEVIRLAPKNAGYRNSRGADRYYKGDLDRGLADFNAAIQLDPKNPRPYNNRAKIWAENGDFGRAVEDYSEAIKLSPKDDDFYRWCRALVHLYSGSPANALLDINRAAQLAWNDPSTALWAEIIGQRNQLPTRLAESTKSMNLDNWAGPLVKLFLAQSTPDAVMAIVEDTKKPEEKQSRLCQANFFIGLWKLQHGERDEAVRLLQQAAGGCPRYSNNNELFAAKSELKLLDR
jgi:lipoprotein NlpI